MPTGDPTCLVHGQIRCNCYENGLRYRWSHLTRDGQDVYVEISSGEQFMYQGEEGRKAYGKHDAGGAWSFDNTKVNPALAMEWLTKPTNRFEQIWGVIYFYHMDWNHMALPTALDSLCKEMFIKVDVHGYRAFVVRKALQSLQDPGFIEFGEKPWEMDDEN